MTMAALFGKLREHELELGRLSEEEDLGRKKILPLSLRSSKEKSTKKKKILMMMMMKI